MAIDNSALRSRVCKACGEEKPLEDFTPKGGGYRSSACKPCRTRIFCEQRRILRELNREDREIKDIPRDIGPDDRIIADGFDVTWMFVVFGEIEGFPDYRVASCGEVWTKRVYTGNPDGEWKRLTQVMIGKDRNYPSVKMTNGFKTVTVRVHRLVLEAFIGSCPVGMQGLHNDDDQSNNKLRNLRYGTPAENTADSIRNGTYAFGSRKRANTITEADVPVIRRLAAEGWTQTAIARKYGIYPSGISRLLSGKLWGHVPRDDEAEHAEP